KFSLDTPVGQMPRRALNLVLYGDEDGTAEVDLDFDSTKDNSQMFLSEYEGVINQLKRWFSAGTSDALREWVEKFMELKTCTTCQGARLKKESLWFRVDEENIATLSNMDLDKLATWFGGIE